MKNRVPVAVGPTMDYPPIASANVQCAIAIVARYHDLWTARGVVQNARNFGKQRDLPENKRGYDGDTV